MIHLVLASGHHKTNQEFKVKWEYNSFLEIFKTQM